MTADERQKVLEDFHPDWRMDKKRKLKVGHNKGELMPHEMIDQRTLAGAMLRRDYFESRVIARGRAATQGDPVTINWGEALSTNPEGFLAKERAGEELPGEALILLTEGQVAGVRNPGSPGHGGIFAEEIRSALYDLPAEQHPVVFGHVVGLGGRDVTPEVIHGIINKTRAFETPEREDLWVGASA